MRLCLGEDDVADLRGRAAATFVNVAVVQTAAGKRNDSCVTAADIVGQLWFHTLPLSAFPRPQRPCCNLVHDGFSTFRRLPHAAVVENLCILHVVVAQDLYL